MATTRTTTTVTATATVTTATVTTTTTKTKPTTTTTTTTTTAAAAAEATTTFSMGSYMPGDAAPQPAKPPVFPPASIPPPAEFLAHLPRDAVASPTALRFPAAWRCGTCAKLHSVLALLAGPSTTTAASSRPGRPQRGGEGEEEDDDDDDDDDDDGDEDDDRRPLCACGRPALQAVYDQFGDLYLFWRDDPAVSDLSVPRMAEEARWRVRAAGADDGWVAGGGGGLGPAASVMEKS
ncbi:hypothetical protein VTH06DRAFT_139 [Thermothelomyces fergusii]